MQQSNALEGEEAEDQEAEVEAVEAISAPEELEDPEVLGQVRVVEDTDRPTSNVTQTCHHCQPVKNITFTESQLIGVRNQPPAPGKIFLCQNHNETVTSLIFMTYKTPCITITTEKYTLLLF